MKDKILGIFYEELELEQSGYLGGICELKGKQEAADAITQLMCDIAINILHWEGRWPPDFFLITNAQEVMLLEIGFTQKQIDISINKVLK